MKTTVITATVIALTATVMTGCFTGVESTPKITEADIRSQHAEARPAEAQFFDTVAPQPFAEWQVGKRFVITDRRISIVLDPQFFPTDSTIVGRTISFAGVCENSTITGQRACEIALSDSTGSNHTYRINASLADLKTRSRVEIPFTIELNVVDEARRLLSGKTLFLVNSSVQDLDGNVVVSPKFLAVIIDKVLPASQFNPIRVVFHYDSMPDVKRQALLVVGTSAISSRSFENNFSFTDPRLAHQSISDEHWRLIVNNQVVQGMNLDECRLAIGKPSHIDRQAARDGLHELWAYDNGTTLIFIDGLLHEFRK